MFEPSLLPKLAFDTLKNIENLNDENLVELSSLFGESLNEATELLENCRITSFQNKNGSRSVFKIGTKKETFTVFENINFCTCADFKSKVLMENRSLTCKHILALELNRKSGLCPVRIEVVTDSQLASFLNEQLN